MPSYNIQSVARATAEDEVRYLEFSRKWWANGIKNGEGYRAAKITMARRIQSARKITPIKRKITRANLRR